MCGRGGCAAGGSCSVPSFSATQGTVRLAPFTPGYMTFHLTLPSRPVLLPLERAWTLGAGAVDDPIGVFVNGVGLYNHTVASRTTFDGCAGHVDTNHRYHYHTTPLPLCALHALLGNTPPTNADWPQQGPPSPVVGFAVDGFPIFAVFDENGQAVTESSLDACSGAVRKDGSYGYYLRPGGTIPCLRGSRKGRAVATRVVTVGACNEPRTMFVSLPGASFAANGFAPQSVEPSSSGGGAKVASNCRSNIVGLSQPTPPRPVVTLAAIFTFPVVMDAVLILCCVMMWRAHRRHVNSFRQRMRSSLAQTMTESERVTLTRTTAPPITPLVRIFAQDIFLLSMCPVIILTGGPMKRSFWPHYGGVLPEQVSDGLGNFLTPASLVYAIVFGSMYTYAMEKQGKVSEGFMQELALLNAVVGRLSNASLMPLDTRNLALGVRQITILLWEQMVGIKGYDYIDMHEYLSCLGALQARVWSIKSKGEAADGEDGDGDSEDEEADIENSGTGSMLRNKKRKTKKTIGSEEEGKGDPIGKETREDEQHEPFQLNDTDQLILEHVVASLGELESARSMNSGLGAMRISWIMWAFLEFLGMCVFIAVILIEVESALMELSMCVVTATAIALLTHVICDLDDPFFGSFNLQHLTGNAEDIIASAAALVDEASLLTAGGMKRINSRNSMKSVERFHDKKIAFNSRIKNVAKMQIATSSMRKPNSSAITPHVDPTN